MLGQRAAASAERIYEILDEQPTIVDAPGAIDLVECEGDVSFDVGRLRLRGRPAGARRTFAAPAARGDGRDGRAHRQRQDDGLAPAAALLRRAAAARSRSTATTCATSRSRACARTSASSSTSRSCSRSRSATTSPTAGPSADLDEVAGGRPRGRRRRVHPRAARRLRHGRRRARLHALGRPAPADRDRADAAGQPADPGPRRRDQRRRRPGRAGDPRGAAGADGGSHDADRRPPPVDDRTRRPGRAARRRADRRGRHAHRAARDARRSTSRCSRRSRRTSARRARRRTRR